MAHVQPHTGIPHAIEVLEKGASNSFYRLLAAIERASRRRADREIERVLGGPMAKFTDESERKIERFLQRRP